MQNKKKIGFVLCLAVLLFLGILSMSACTKKDARGAVTFEGVQEIHAPVGTVTEESLMAGVTAKDANGKNKEVTLDLDGADLSKPGLYIIQYICGEDVRREALYLYGDISYKVNGQTLEGEKLEISFADAITSLDFTKTVVATDSFGDEIPVRKLEGGSFDYTTGEFTVKYTATDKAGQTAEKTITYVVTSNVEMSVQTNISVKYEQESVTFKVDLDGESNVWLMGPDGIVSVRDFTISEDKLELKASYYRTLAPGENTLKLCSMNGYVEFAFTVVDTGKPIFTFDSPYKTNIIVGSPAVYGMPKAQVAGHEYSYTFKVTKDGVSYKAEQKGNSILFTTSSGKSLSPGIYNVSVTATNKADTSKKTTIKGNFRIYTNQAEIDGWQIINAPAGSTVVNVDLSDRGFFRTAWKYDARSPSAWDGRLVFAKAKAKTFQSITFNFYVYSLGIAEKENGPVKYVGKNGVASIPFYAVTSSGEVVATMLYDMNGKIVDNTELKMNTWYTIKIDVSELTKDSDLALCTSINNTRQAGMYITEMHFWAYEGTGVQNVFRDEDKTATIQRNASKSDFITATLEDEKVWMYTVTEKHQPSTSIKRSVKVNTSKTKEVVSIDFKFVEEAKDLYGNVLAPKMFVHDVDYPQKDIIYGAGYTIVDVETGKPVEAPEVGKWYTLYITTQGRENYLIYPMGDTTTPLTCKVAFKNLQTYDVELGNATFSAAFGNTARASLYKTAEDKWQYSYISYTGWSNYANTTWNRRARVMTTGDVAEVRFQFKFEKAKYLAKDAESEVDVFALIASVESASHPALVTTIYDQNFNVVAAGTGKIGEWYYAVVTRADGKNFENPFCLLVGGQVNGGDGNIFNVEMKMRDMITVAPTVPQTMGNVTFQSAGMVDALKSESGLIRYSMDKETAASTIFPSDRAVKLTVDDDSKGLIEVLLTLNSAKDQNDQDVNPWLVVENADGWNKFVVTDENNLAVKYLEAGKTYKLFVTTGNCNAVTIYPAGKNGEKIYADLTIREAKAHAISDMPLTMSASENFANVSYYVDENGLQYSYQSDTALRAGNGAWQRRIRMVLDAEDYQTMSFQIRYLESKKGENTSHFLDIYQCNVVHYDENYNVVDQSNIQDGIWYTVVVTKKDGSALRQDCDYNYTVSLSDGADVSVLFQMRNIKLLKKVSLDVDFNLNYEGAGTPPTAIKVDAGSGYGTLPTVERNGYTFDGWYLNQECTGAAVKTTTPVISSHTLYAKWIEGVAKYAVSFDLNYEGAGAPPTAIEVEAGAAYSTLPTPNRTYHIFNGWYTDAACSGEAVSATTTVSAAHTLYAKWTLDTEAVGATITYPPDSGSYYAKVSAVEVDGEFAYKCVVDSRGAPTNHIVRRVHLNIANTAGQVISMKVMITEGNAAMAIGNRYTTPIAATFVDVETDTVVDAGALEMNKWYTMSWIADGSEHYQIQPFSGSAIDGTFYMKDIQGGSVAEKHTVSFDLNYEGAGAPPAAINVDAGAAYGTLPTVSREGYEFGGWYTDAACSGEAVSATATVSASHTLYAKWILREVPVVEFSTPGALADPVMSLVGGKIQYTITGSTGSAVSSAERSLTVTVVDGNATALSFEMKLSNLANVTASISGADSALNVKFYDAECTEVTALTADAWYKLVVTKADGSAFGTTAWNLGYLGGTGRGTGKLDVEIRNVVVTFSEIPKAEVSFNLNYEGATGAPKAIEITIGDGYGDLPVPTRTGYAFGGWYTDAACSGEAVSATATVSASHTLYAKWTLDTDAVGATVTYPPDSGSYYAKVSAVEVDGEFAYKAVVDSRGDPTNAIVRRVHLNVTAAQKQIVSMEVKITECSGTPAISIANQNTQAVGQVITDAAGNIADRNNLQLNQWYTVTWIADGSAHYQIQPFAGSAINGTYYMKNITVKDLEGPLASTYYAWVAPFAMGDQTAYMCYARVTGDPTEIGNRQVDLSSSASAGDMISMKLMIAETTGTPQFAIKNASGTDVSFVVADSDGNVVDSTAMELNKWYTMTWIADGSASYRILSFAGTKANGTYFVKDIKTQTVENPFVGGESNGYYANAIPYVSGEQIAYKAVVNSKGAPTNHIVRRLHLTIPNTAGQVISMKVMITEGNAAMAIGNRYTTPIAATFVDVETDTVVDAGALEMNKWYTMSWTADGSEHYQIQPFSGSAIDGTFYMKDIKAQTPPAI